MRDLWILPRSISFGIPCGALLLYPYSWYHLQFLLYSHVSLMSSKCFTTGQNCCQPFIFLLSRMFTYELRVSPSDEHATIPLFHWLSSCFPVVHVFYQCDIRILVFSHEKRKLLLLKFRCFLCYRLVKFLWKSCENLGWFLWDSCGILVKIQCMLADCCGVIPPASAHKKSRLESRNRPRGARKPLCCNGSRHYFR